MLFALQQGGLGRTGQQSSFPGGGGGGGSDPNFADVVLLLHGDGSNGSTSVADSSSQSQTVTCFGGCALTTSQKKFGTAAMNFPLTGNDYIEVTASADFTFGTGDFTVDGWVRPSSGMSVAGGVFVQGTSLFPSSVTNTVAFGTVDSGSVWQLYANNTNTNSAATWSANTWYHFEVSRSGTTTRLFIDGVVAITVTGDSTDYTGTFFGMGKIFGTYQLSGQIDDLRVTKGVARHTSGFSVPTAAYPDS